MSEAAGADDATDFIVSGAAAALLEAFVFACGAGSDASGGDAGGNESSGEDFLARLISQSIAGWAMDVKAGPRRGLSGAAL